MPTLHVDLGERSYPIYIQAGILSDAGFLFSEIRAKHIIIISNTVVSPLYLDTLAGRVQALGKRVDRIVIADGEQEKTLANFEYIMSKLLAMPASRDACIVALGGGVIGDLAGFVSACYQRGIDFVQVPTTLLSQVDSSVGGKTAVNHPLGKNMIGAFYQPKAVYIDTATLSTLAPREFAAGMAEVIKYGIIYDLAFFTWLENNIDSIKRKDSDTLNTMIARCCEIKATIVAQDEREQNIRALLNLGHTFGHAIEAEQGFGNWLHGEAVAAGMVIAARLSAMRGDVDLTEVTRISQLIAAFDLPIAGPGNMNAAAYISHMQRDKKAVNNAMRFVLPIGIGKAKVVGDVSSEALTELLDVS
ncbi:3-dehydroquinate synthase [Glaciecola siphonariae]|uniref:3-dehydroquinate synthase n=1 Tax=Glaciecola siphonariae TaxID=521012 RepID=A0ABV9LY81_9ALTE